jgi:hypothetical protein
VREGRDRLFALVKNLRSEEDFFMVVEPVCGLPIRGASEDVVDEEDLSSMVEVLVFSIDS